jgi:hypothetical protein
MSVKSPTHASAALPEGVRPSHEMNEVLIRKFLKSCKKEDLEKNVFDKSAGVRRYESKHRADKIRRKANKERAIRETEKADRAETAKSKR